MVTLRRPPQFERRGPVLEPYQVVIRPLITEKATHISERYNAYTFEVNPLAGKTEIKNAIENLFKVKVAEVRTTTTAGKLRRRGRFSGYRADWKKAYVRLKTGQKMPEYAEI